MSARGHGVSAAGYAPRISCLSNELSSSIVLAEVSSLVSIAHSGLTRPNFERCLSRSSAMR